MNKPQETQSYNTKPSNYSKEDKFGYKGWMNSDSFLKRSFGVFGYQMVAGCMVQAVVMAIFLFFAVIFGGFGALMSNF
jgi:hypothetical protein